MIGRGGWIPWVVGRKVFSFPSSPLERNVGIANDEVLIATRRDAPIVAMTTTSTKIRGGDVGRRRRRRRSCGRRDVRGVVPWTNVTGGRSHEGNVRGNPTAMGRPLLVTAAPTATEAMPMMAEGKSWGGDGMCARRRRWRESGG
jgi:hypothetical protein